MCIRDRCWLEPVHFELFEVDVDVEVELDVEEDPVVLVAMIIFLGR